MCQPAGFVLTKDGVFWSKGPESHEATIEEFDLHTDGVRGPNVLRVELTPPDQDFRKPLEEWVWRLDQDVMPGWFDATRDEARTREAAPDWLAAKVVLPDEIRDRVEGHDEVVAVYGNVNRVSGSAQVRRVSGSAQVYKVYDSAQVRRVSGSAQVYDVCDYGQVHRVYDSGQVHHVYDSAQVHDVCGSARVHEVSGSGQVHRVYGFGQVHHVYDSAQVHQICGSGQVYEVYGSGQVHCVYGFGQVHEVGGEAAVLIDRSRPEAVCRVGSSGC